MYKKEEMQLFGSNLMVIVCKWHEDLLPCPQEYLLVRIAGERSWGLKTFNTPELC